jgi:hypothetical protein
MLSFTVREEHKFIWTVNLLKPGGSVCTAWANMLKLFILSTKCICMFHMALTINTEYFPKEH